MNYFLTDSKCPVCKSKLFSGFPGITAVCSTRSGGVSEGIHASMNLGFKNGDDPEKVHENFRIFCGEIGTEPENLVFARQTHTNNVRVVNDSDRGKGIFKECDYTDIDALVTNTKKLALVIQTADCVPVSIYDPVNKAIGLAHSGWRGTALQITAKTIRKMIDEFGSKPENLYVSTGPSICRSCYEVSSDVVTEFQKAYNDSEMKKIAVAKPNGKYLLDLCEAIKITALKAGVKPDNFENTGFCTCCNFEMLFSHRATGGKRGTLATFLFMNGKE